ncbi:PQQ-binding-like beta-propeller repeat protein [Streptomyces pseudovenezuelae]|uniref:PQQ-binding-like beta-propeller repeat protein n=1 Tax=Streptomyces pseudovenezuelae TaxID=67350 RepID=UPI002E81FFE5|nr:PQQ-binding-like beta-propeller repeat protein [Streptomyces pseudovenezuelae]WUA93898.1 PQQ-binding-like beta-propeller repeat protein [Streptomyces pseudovenezuelae]
MGAGPYPAGGRSSGPCRSRGRAAGGNDTISKPVVVDGRVYCGSHAGVYALDAASGKVLWITPKGAVWPPYNSPAVADGLVYTGSGEDSHLHAFEATNGKPRWTFATDGEVQGAPVVANGTIYFGSLTGTMYAVNAKTGGKIPAEYAHTDSG